jgi:antitoxin MazE
MKAALISIGNSRGVRIPKSFIEQCGLGGEVDLELRAGQILIRPLRQARAGWAEAFREMAARGDDKLLDGGGPATRWDKEEWAWK